MSETPLRSSRRSAARRKKVIESDDEENICVKNNKDRDQSEEEFTPVPKRSSRKAAVPQRRNTRPVVEIPSSKKRKRDFASQEKTPVPKSSQLEHIEVPGSISLVNKAENKQSEALGLISPVNNAQNKKREYLEPTSPVNNGQSNQSEVTSVQKEIYTDAKSEANFQLPTPNPSQSPESAQHHKKSLTENKEPLEDQLITEKPSSIAKPLASSQTILEKPMEIVLKTRSTTIPTVINTEPKPRIVITYLILTNFKSYAGRQEVGPFHTSFSSVVGPNGSGKSNVIDSLLFVFGFRASKMRQGKISALIHNSAAFPDLNYCEVAVHFQEVMDQTNGPPNVLPNSELIISRRAFKNNSSKYFLNNRESNFTEVTTLLRKRGIDLDHKRFLILQGEVESIAQMKPKAANEHDDGLLEYLEDIIGTSKYKTPIEESANQVETLNEVCVEKSSRVHHVEKEKNNLEDRKNKALAYIKEENELTIKQSGLYQIYIDECSNNLSITVDATAKMQAQFDAELEKHQGNEDGIKNMNQLYENGQKEYEMVEKELTSITKEMAKFDQEHIKFNEKKKFLVDKQKKTEKLMSDSKAASTDSQLTIENCTSEIESSCQKITEMEKQIKHEIDELATIRENLKGKTQIFSDQISEKQKSLEPWNEKINQNLSAIAVAESELAILHDKANAGTIALTDTESKIASIKSDVQSKNKELEFCRTQKSKLERNVNQVQSELDQMAKNEPEIRSKLSSARQKADEARASLSKTQTQGNVLTGLMRLKESGRVDGFHGRLGNLGTIDQQYDIAISTACAALNNFVTDNVEGAQQCIEYLRKTNLGRGNFMCLDKIGVKDISPIQTPENVPRLFDLIKSKDEKFRPAFFHSLQNTLVAQDLAQANRIAYGARRWRVVTLNGQLIDKSGTMSGGGNTVKQGLMSSKLTANTTKDQVIKLESDRDFLESSFQRFLERQKQLEASLRDLNDQIPQLETRIQKTILELESSAKNLADSQRRIQELSKEHQPSMTDDARVKSLEKGITKLSKEIENLRGETASVENEIKLLQEKIMQIGGEKLRAQKIKVDSLKEEINSIGEKISAAEVNRAKAEKQKTKQEKNYNKAVKDNEAAIIDLQKLEEEILNQSSNAQDYQSKIAEINDNLQCKKKELNSLKKELDVKISVLNEIRAVEIEMRNKLEENQKILNENRSRLKYWTEKLGKLTLQNVSDLGEETELHEGLPEYTKDELAGMSKETLKSEIAALEEKTQNANVDLGVLAEYRRRVEEFAARNADLQDAVSQRDTAKKCCDELRHLRLQGFMEGFAAISLRLKEMYQMITMGGNAELELVDSLDPFSEGILFSVMPPKKSWKNISNLSGGEKTLSSLALVFALHHYKPTPLYVMDEIDAALDFRNVSIVANYIKERTKNAQFIVISLRNNMFELATRLIGVYKVNHMTKSVTIENKDYINGAT